jgi:hypothetical protein
VNERLACRVKSVIGIAFAANIAAIGRHQPVPVLSAARSADM